MTRLEQLRNIDIDDVLSMVGLARRPRMSVAEAFFMGLGVGLAGGAVATLMLTPFTGSETREKLLRAGEDLGRSVSNKMNEVKGSLSNRAGEVKGNLRSGQSSPELQQPEVRSSV